MDLNVAVSTASELFGDNDIVFPILLGRENLKILASPGSESSGVSSLDAEEAKKLANEQLPTSTSPTLASESSSSEVQTESESSDGSSDADADADEDKQIEQNTIEFVKLSDETEKETDASTDDEDDEEDDDDDDDDDSNNSSEDADNNDDESKSENAKNECEDAGERQPELVSQAAATPNQEENDAKTPSIDLDEIRYKHLKIVYEGRDILDFSANVANKSWSVQYAHLPEKNYQMYINNRSQYNRLAAGYESPENYTLNTCGKCAFHFPVVDLDKIDQPAAATAAAAAAAAIHKSNVNELLTHTVASIVSRDSPIQSISALKLQAQSLASSIHAPNAQAMNLNNFMMNNNAASAAVAAATPTGQSPYAYQNQNQNRNQFAGVNNNNNQNNNNNHSCYKQNNIANTFSYGNNVMLNALVNQIGNNINNMNNMNMNSMNNMNNINNSSAFNSNFMNALNGTNGNNNNNNANLNQLSNLANLMNQNRQQIYGMCRQNINKSGINFNANSHKPMPTYSHF